MKLAALFLMCLPLVAQQLSIVAPARVNPGQTIAGRISFTAGSDIAALVFTLPAGAVVSGAQPAVPSKSQICATSRICAFLGVAPAPVGGIFAAGSVFNSSPIASGDLQAFSYLVPASIVPGTVINLQLSGVLGASPNGAPVPVTFSGASVVVSDPSDLNQDGAVDGADRQLALTQWLLAATGANFFVMALLWPKIP